MIGPEPARTDAGSAAASRSWAAYPLYAIERVLEHGDEEDVAWLLRVFSRDEIRDVLRADRRLTPRSANFWALVFAVPAPDVAAPRGAVP